MLNITQVRRLLLLIPCLLALFCSQQSLALKPEHEGKRLLLAAKQALENNNLSLAEQQLNKVRTLQIQLPPEFNYYQARVLIHRGQRDSARRYLEHYVDDVGSGGEYYEDALKQITRLNQKQRQKSKVATTKGVDPNKATLKWSSTRRTGKAYIDHLQMLYMVDTPVKALVVHINNLLDFYAYADSRIIASSALKHSVRHSIRTTKSGEIVTTTKSVPADKKQPAREDRFPVFGVNPYVEYRCSNSTSSCWIMHPYSSQQWLYIVQNQKAATELSQAITELIKKLQKGG